MGGGGGVAGDGGRGGGGENADEIAADFPAASRLGGRSMGSSGPWPDKTYTPSRDCVPKRMENCSRSVASVPSFAGWRSSSLAGRTWTMRAAEPERGFEGGLNMSRTMTGKRSAVDELPRLMNEIRPTQLPATIAVRAQENSVRHRPQDWSRPGGSTATFSGALSAILGG